MGAGHGHAPAGHAGSRFRRRLAVTFALTATFLVVELTAGLLAGSLALVSDAAHMATDVVALGASWLATHLAVRPDTSGRRTYGHYRSEVFASGVAVLLMLGAGAYVLVEAVARVGEDPLPETQVMVVVGLLGLAVSAVGLVLLRPGAEESLNVRGAYLEVLADAAGSVGVLVAAALVATTGVGVWDTVVGATIGLFVLVRAWLLGRQVVSVLAQHTPAGIDPDAVAADLGAVPGVRDVHDLHLWTLTSGMNVATAHLMTSADTDSHPVLDRAREVLAGRYGIDHATLQVEPDTHTGCHEVSW
ncbi:MAG: cation diffusion facilitator family transporter [Actinomycetes bacterium]